MVAGQPDLGIELDQALDDVGNVGAGKRRPDDFADPALLCAAVCLGLNVGLDLLLIPTAGAPGAAWATLAAEALMAASLLALTLRTLAKLTAAAPPARS